VLERNSASSVSGHKLPLVTHAQLAHVWVEDRNPVAAQVKFADSWVLQMASAGSAVTHVGTGPEHLESGAASAEFVVDRGHALVSGLAAGVPATSLTHPRSG
jgi:hypothetical protein